MPANRMPRKKSFQIQNCRRKKNNKSVETRYVEIIKTEVSEINAKVITIIPLMHANIMPKKRASLFTVAGTKTTTRALQQTLCCLKLMRGNATMQ
jgi:hypothetical protein